MGGAEILMHQEDLPLYEKVKEQCRDFGVPPPKAPLAPPDAFVAHIDKIECKLGENGLKCSRILVTHGHLDHILGATELKLRTGAEILMHQEGIPSLQGTSDPEQIICSI